MILSPIENLSIIGKAQFITLLERTLYGLCCQDYLVRRGACKKTIGTVRQHLHERFDQWLDGLETYRLPEAELTLAQVSETIWTLRQQLTGGLAAMIVQHAHKKRTTSTHLTCPPCECLLPASAPVARTVETMVGPIELERPYFYCRRCRHGSYPFDEVLGLSAGRLQLDVQQATADLVTELPYETRPRRRLAS